MKQLGGVCITGGRLVLPGEVRHGSVRLAQGRIAAVGDVAAEPGDQIIDARGALIAPALIDLGVFAVDRGAFHFGGIARAALMPDQSPPLDHPSSVNFTAKRGKPDLWVHPLAAATKGLAGTDLAEFALMQEAGARGIATGRHWIADSGVMLRVLQYAAMLDLPVIAHAEDGFLAGRAVATAGEIATRLGLASAPAQAEVLAIARDLVLAEMTGARLHFRQVTTRAGLALVRQAKARGIGVTAGVTPAHFMLSDLAVHGFRSFARLSPPLRSEDDRQAVREAIADGTIDVIASGHDPQAMEEKRLPFAEAAPGMAGAQTLLPLVLSLVRDGLISLERAFDLMAAAPARILRVDAGVLEAGREADVALIAPDCPWIVESSSLNGMAGNTPFDRKPVQGRCIRLFKGGVEPAS
ncbi:dihydroorotase family protein [Porphyrobacter sp. GA68]|uniref:dihydroorotase n=1 Tax=Porphyrobacter sp. GA68 TaxID=2883480 RepID=UPI001D194CBF|nr:dihydroorotase [Porphyrobacter sp. GA68]